ncbi:hypothetical protein EYF80_014828 [Liparis tanakae]|uniref:Uncharacterized protein n=1 Tax=Liparis tanakae TaxID=230148 RepID=A0A4Z2IAK6_9TELE|nr:hypothetical protein EYF80_014828 [Liparis tanakae]
MAPSSRSTAALFDFHSPPSFVWCSLEPLSIPPPPPPPPSCPPLPITPLSSLFAPNFTITLPTPDASTLFRLDFWQVSEMIISTRTSELAVILRDRDATSWTPRSVMVTWMKKKSITIHASKRELRPKDKS